MFVHRYYLKLRQPLLLIGLVFFTLHIATSPVSAAVGDGLVIYGEATVTTPRYRSWNQATASFGAEATGVAAAATIRHTAIVAATTRDEIIAGVQATTGTLYIQRWNGSAWSNEWNVSVGNSNTPRFDIAYEESSGRALVLYSRNVGTTNELAYRIWNGTSWTAATNLDSTRTSGVVHGIRLESRPGSNDIAAVWGDANFDLSANYWNSTTSTWTGEPSAALSTNLSKVGTSTTLTNMSFDLDYEKNSGELLVVWGNDAIQDVLYATRGAGIGGTWNAVQTNTTFAEEVTDLVMESDKNSNHIAVANATDNTAGAEAGMWDGTSWTAINNFDSSVDTVGAGTKNITVGWVSSGEQTRAVVAYDDVNATGIDWLFYNKNTNSWSSVQADFTTAPAAVGTDDKLLRIRPNPFQSNQLMLVLADANSDLFAKRLSFDGTNLVWSSVEPGATALELTLSNITGFAADFAFYRLAPGTLTVDMVDAAGSSIASPNLAFPAVILQHNCQISTTTLGSSNQKIRIQNTTANPSWTLTIAVTSGNGSLWNTGSLNYDFNDSSGTPPGCTDGIDIDSKAGRLSINPSSGSFTPQSGCSTTGVALGNNAAFTEGTTDSITLASASGAPTNCYWDILGITLNQQIPPETPVGSYTLSMTMTVTAN